MHNQMLVTHRLTILFEPNEDFLEAYEELKGKEVLSLEIKPYRKKRSLDANAYYWVLLTKLAVQKPVEKSLAREVKQDTRH